MREQIEADLDEAKNDYEADWAVIELLRKPEAKANMAVRHRAVLRILRSYRACRSLGYKPPRPADGA